MNSSTDYDAIVIGGGPAGSTCAWFLGRARLHVLLVDRDTFPRDKVCGDGWGHRKAVPILQELGVLDELGSVDNLKIRGLFVGAPSGDTIHVTLPRQPHAFAPFGLTCRRSILDERLWQHARQVVDTTAPFRVTEVLRAGKGVVRIVGCGVQSSARQSFTSHVIVGADGAQSIVAQRLGFRRAPSRQAGVGFRTYYEGVEGLSDHVELYFLRSLLPGYFWVFPLGDHAANVGVVTWATRIPRGQPLEQRLERVIAEQPVLSRRFANATRTASIHGWVLPARARIGRVVDDGAVLVGDAAGLIDPWLWEGLGNALLSGKLAAETIVSAVRCADYSARTLASYDHAIRRDLGPELARGARLQWLACQPGLLNVLVSCVQRTPRLAEFLSANLVRPEAHRGLTSLALGWRAVRERLGDW